LAALLNLFLVGFQGAFHPIVMKHYMERTAPERFKTVFNYFLFITLSILVGVSVYGKEILMLVTTEAFSQGYVVVPLLVLAAILASIGGYFTFGIQIKKKSSYRLILNVGILIINIVLNIVLIPKYGVIGAALATMLSFLVLSLVGMMISQSLYYVPYEWGKAVAAMTLAAIASNLVIFLDLDVSLYIFLAKAVLIGLMVFVISRLLGMPLSRNILKWKYGYREDDDSS
jgi:O-antigen/teichoic acid export membrane protein